MQNHRGRLTNGEQGRVNVWAQLFYVGGAWEIDGQLGWRTVGQRHSGVFAEEIA
ncbi:MAG: hypothetical protein MI924_20860 [Chloroflexales bacterium]|nr:hypothetical protein [Chloroflexales bacterium]